MATEKRKPVKVISQPSCVDSGEVLIKLPAFLTARSPISKEAVEMALLLWRMSDKQLGYMLRKQLDEALALMIKTMKDEHLVHMLRKQSDELTAQMIRMLVERVVESHGSSEQKKEIRTLKK